MQISLIEKVIEYFSFHFQKLADTQKYKDEIIELKRENEHLRNELDTVHWHIKFLADGRTAKQILSAYERALDQIRNMQAELNSKDKVHEKALRAEQKETKKALRQIK